MDVFYSVVHREAGQLVTYLTKQEADRALIDAVGGEPSFRPEYAIEMFTLVVADVEVQ